MLSCDFDRLGAWISLDSNFWFGGVTALDGLQNPTRQTRSRLGATGSLPVSKHQSLKLGYSHGTHVRCGGNYYPMSVAVAVRMDRATIPGLGSIKHLNRPIRFRRKK